MKFLERLVRALFPRPDRTGEVVRQRLEHQRVVRKANRALAEYHRLEAVAARRHR